MSNKEVSDLSIFKKQEQTGWDSKAKHYDSHAGEITRKAVQLLLTAADVKTGTRVLDVACGPGYVAGYAAEQGAIATGVDFAPGMVAEASKNFPNAEFQPGDAEALVFDDNTFDVVICAFGLLHFAEPDKAIAEAFRVLRPGGHYVFTVWCLPEKHDFFKLVLDAIESHGTFDVSLPEAPSIFRFSEQEECINTLSAAGFTEIQITELPLNWKPATPEDILSFLEKSSVRTAMVLERQSPDALVKIHQSILNGAQQLRRGESLHLEWPAVMAIGKKPDIG
ncbi:class I SAM-dependent methyltransferase [Kaarinaea lacus]